MSDPVDAPPNGAAPLTAEPDDLASTVADAVKREVFGEFQKWSDAHARKTGKEIGRIRSRFSELFAGDEGATPDAPPASTPAPRDAATVTAGDLDAAMRIGELRAGLSEAQREQLAPLLDGQTHTQQAAILEAVTIATAGATPAELETPGATPPKKRARAAAPAQRSGAKHPRSMMEYVKIAREDPALKRQLDADPTFDPSVLPYARRG